MGLLAFSDAIAAVVVDENRCCFEVRKFADGRVKNFVSPGNFEGFSALKRGDRKVGYELPGLV